MKKRNLNDAVSNLLGGQHVEDFATTVKRDARVRSRSSISHAVDKNKPGYETVTISVNSELYAKIKEIAFKENLTIKKVVEQAMFNAIEAYESNYGEVKLRKIKQGNQHELFI